jgi:ribose-phosphate pyrophosphokinase
MDLHDPQFQGLFDIPVDNLFSKPLLEKWIKEKVLNYKSAVIVSPDAGGAKRASSIANGLKMDFALIHRERAHDSLNIVGNVTGKVCILVDDISDTCITITKAAKYLHEHGATKIIALCTHGVMSGEAIDRINTSFIDEMVVSNTIPQSDNLKRCPKMKVIDVKIIFAEAIRRIHNGESVSFLFDSLPY